MLALPPIDTSAIHAYQVQTVEHVEHVQHREHVAHEKAIQLRHIQAVIAHHDAKVAAEQLAQAQQQQALAPLPAMSPSPSQLPMLNEGPPAGGSFEACVIARESGGDAQIVNASGHWGLFQFSASTYAEYGGTDFGSASAAEQIQVFDNAMATPGGASNWAPYDGC